MTTPAARIADTPSWASELTPVYVAGLFKPLLAELLQVLRGLSSADWERPTVAGSWKVRDIAGHLLDGDLRKIAACRDGHMTPPDFPIESARDLTRFVNHQNAAGVSFAARLSPRLLVDLLETTGAWAAELIGSLDPAATALWPVSWAGENESTNWMDTGREYTERWHHQMQIRDAVGAPRLLGPNWMKPLLELSVRAFPVTYEPLEAPEGTAVAFVVEGETDGAWTVFRSHSRWRVVRGQPSEAAARVRVATDDAWRLLYNAATPALLARVSVEGDAALAEPMLRTRSVIV